MEEDTLAGPYSLYLDLIERELGTALADLNRLRSLQRRKEAAKDRCLMLRVALSNFRYYIRELENLLD